VEAIGRRTVCLPRGPQPAIPNFNADLDAYTSDCSTHRGRIRKLLDHILRPVGLAGSLSSENRDLDVLKDRKNARTVADCCGMGNRLHKVTNSLAERPQRARDVGILVSGVRE
jgi:hypothetical protein